MTYKKDQIKPYLGFKAELIPLHVWNKLIKGDERGKTPIHSEWNTKVYGQDKATYLKWIDSGYNIGYRIKENELIVDLDPRNYVDGIDSEELIADLFGFFDFEELLWELPVVKTGGGGYHIYCTLPYDVDYRCIRKCVENIPGVDFKKKGGYVVAAGSKHPNGDYYAWENQAERPLVPEALLNLIKRDKFENKDYSSGYGAFTGTQLQDLVLDKLDVNDFDSNDTWEPLMMECHHATAGDGIEEFLDWSLSDTNYSGDENKIRNRWESLDDTKDVTRTAASLIRRLKQQGEDTSGAKAVLEFSKTMDFSDIDEEDSEEAEIMKEVSLSASKVDISEMMDIPKEKQGVEGSALEFINSLPTDPNGEDVEKALRFIKVSNSYEAKRATKLLMDKTKLTKGDINDMLKEQEATLMHSIGELLSNSTLDKVFSRSRHIVTEEDGQVWIYRKTHWQPISDEYLGKITYAMLDTMKKEMQVKINEQAMVSSAVKSMRMRTSASKSRIHTTGMPKPIINCANGELHLNTDGSHELREHKYNSYQISCLSADYDPSATAPLFMSTLEDIFAKFNDGEDMIRHLGEIMGYIAQPYKPDADWWLFQGPGGDGKSTIVEIMKGILQESQIKTDVGTISSVGGSSRGNDGALAAGKLVGKLNVVIEEIPRGIKLNDAGLKLLAGGGNPSMEGRFLYSKPFSFRYVGSLIMCANHYPYVGSHDGGTMRRANVVPFNAKFHESGKQDPHRVFKILSDKEEISGILNFMLEGYKRYCERGGFQVPKSCKLATEAWLMSTSNVARFMNEETNKVKGEKIKCTELWEHYKTWCHDIAGTKEKGRNSFYQELEDLKYTIVKGGKNIRYVDGCSLVRANIDFEPEDEL